MTAISKFYLHAAASADTGTLPASNATVSALTHIQTVSLTNKSMNDTIGTAQASVAYSTLANTSAQQQPIARFLSDPIAAQTIAAQNISVHYAGSESNANSNFNSFWSLAVWRPGTGAVVGRPTDGGQSGDAPFTSTSETAQSTATLSSSAVTSQDGDILVLELWRDSASQTMSTSYTNTFFFDGTTEDSATSNAAYLLFTNAVTMFTGAQAPAEPIRVGASVAAQSASIH